MTGRALTTASKVRQNGTHARTARPDCTGGCGRKRLPAKHTVELTKEGMRALCPDCYRAYRAEYEAKHNLG